MYDPTTERLILSIPNLENVDSHELPKTLSKLYSDILSFSEDILTGNHQRINEEHLKRIKAISNTLEIYILATHRSDAEIRASAFVAATSRHLLSLYYEELNRNQVVHPEVFYIIPSRIVSSILFFVSGYMADTLEVAKNVNFNLIDERYQFVYRNIVSLITGKRCTSRSPDFSSETLWEEPSLILLRRINGLIDNLSSYSFGEIQYTQDAFDAEVNLIQRDCSVNMESRFQEGTDGNSISREQVVLFTSSFSLPLHLVKLLKLVGFEVFRKSIISIAPPVDDLVEWRDNIRVLYSTRPYVWENHLAAVSTGYLRQGISSVVSLPTGAGKTTIANLKIASSLVGGGKVIYIVPTHALAHQVKNSLQEVFSQKVIRESLISDGAYTEAEEVSLADITVMTPERFLSLVGMYRQIYPQISLIIFDECHLLHSLSGEKRSIDSMILLLKILDNAPQSDFLLMSAMISNSSEIANWLEHTWHKRAVSISMDWKPTRQLRGCLVFDTDRIRQVNAAVIQYRNENLLRRPNAAVKRLAAATPFGLFCLRREWTRSRNDYALLRLINQDVQLALNNSFRLTPNKNILARNISEKIVLQGRKVLIFAQNRKHCESIARETARSLNIQEVRLSDYEISLRNSIASEVGDISKSIGVFDNKASCHHSLMLPQERLLVESLFSRQDGVKLLVATPTLAQGLNLPAEVVIIAGDERFNSSEDGMESMEAFEILNAAGRAGRAGHSSNGMVLVIPSKIVSYSAHEQISGNRWAELQTIFSSGDQTVNLTDPFEFILSNLASGADVEEGKLNYLLSMLPSGYEEDESRLGRMLRKTLAFHSLRQGNKLGVAEGGIARAISLQAGLPESEAGWKEDIVEATGLPLQLIESIIAFCVPIQGEILNGSVRENIFRVFEWLGSSPEYTSYFFKESNLSQFYGDYVIDTQVDLRLYREMLLVWIEGCNLVSVEDYIQENLQLSSIHDKARIFALRVVPEIAYLSGFFTLILKKLNEGNSNVNVTALSFVNFSSCIREGFYSPIDLAGRYLLGVEVSRSEVRVYIDSFRDRVPALNTINNLGELMGFIRRLGEEA